MPFSYGRDVVESIQHQLRQRTINRHLRLLRVEKQLAICNPIGAECGRIADPEARVPHQEHEGFEAGWRTLPEATIVGIEVAGPQNLLDLVLRKREGRRMR